MQHPVYSPGSPITGYPVHKGRVTIPTRNMSWTQFIVVSVANAIARSSSGLYTRSPAFVFVDSSSQAYRKYICEAGRCSFTAWNTMFVFRVHSFFCFCLVQCTRSTFVQLPPGTLVTKIYFFFVNKLNFILKPHTHTQDFKLMLCDCHRVYLGGGGGLG